MFRKRKKHQVRIQHQNQQTMKRKLFFKFILFVFIIGAFLVLYQKQNRGEKSDIFSEKEGRPQQKKTSTLMDKNIKKQIQKDYKTNLLKQKMAQDSARYKKNQYVAKPASAKPEDYTLKDGVDLSQDPSFDDLLSILKTAEEESGGDIEERIAGYRIIEKKIQNFQGKPEEDSDDDIDPRKAYAQEFIENARKGGYEVKLDDNFKVKSVKKMNP